jgi:hypothetical protein
MIRVPYAEDAYSNRSRAAREYIHSAIWSPAFSNSSLDRCGGMHCRTLRYECDICSYVWVVTYRDPARTWNGIPIERS